MTRSAPLVATACVLLAPILSAQPAPTCEQWNTAAFFEVATVQDVTACLDAGSDVSARTEDGYTPLHHAARESEQPEVIDALLAAGADADTRDQDGDTPLSQAAFDVSSRAAVVESLLAAGANPRTRNEYGRTPLHYAAAVWKAPEIAALLAAGAQPMARDDGGRTPLHHAADPLWSRLVMDPQQAVDALLDAGADPIAEDDDGTTPWDLAKENDDLRGSDVYWRMNDARFADPPREVRRPSTTSPRRRQATAPQTPPPKRELVMVRSMRTDRQPQALTIYVSHDFHAFSAIRPSRVAGEAYLLHPTGCLAAPPADTKSKSVDAPSCSWDSSAAACAIGARCSESTRRLRADGGSKPVGVSRVQEPGGLQ